MTPAMKLLLPAMLIASFSLTACAQAPAPAAGEGAANGTPPASGPSSCAAGQNSWRRFAFARSSSLVPLPSRTVRMA